MSIRGSQDVWLWRDAFHRGSNERYELSIDQEVKKRRQRERKRRHRRNRIVQGHAAKRLIIWMYGYDGPSPTPASAWPKIIEHMMRYGL